MTARVRKILAAGKPLTFGELYALVTKTAPASKFAVKSALGKGRERGEYQFTGDRYGLKTQKSPRVVDPRAHAAISS